MSSEKRGISEIITVLMVLVLFFVILMLVVFAAVSYQRTVGMQDAAENKRAVLSYVITAVKADQSGEVSLKEIDGKNAVVIRDTASGYEQRIYHANGHVMENYGLDGSEIDEEESLVIGDAEQFDAEYVSDDLIRIRTELGSSYIHIEPQQGLN